MGPPYDGNPPLPGNGVHIAYTVDTRAKVDAFHAAALANGGSDEGAPGERGNGYYVAYWRDPDGNKMNAVALG